MIILYRPRNSDPLHIVSYYIWNGSLLLGHIVYYYYYCIVNVAAKLQSVRSPDTGINQPFWYYYIYRPRSSDPFHIVSYYILNGSLLFGHIVYHYYCIVNIAVKLQSVRSTTIYRPRNDDPANFI